jgi:hypothetical protein
MDVFLVPVGAAQYALYCESPAAAEPEEAGQPQTLWARAVRVFRRMLAEGEAERARDPGEPPVERGRVRRWIAMRLASAVAEQRLLWHLRHESQASLVYPDDLGDADAVAIAQAHLSLDYVRHLRWCIIDTLLAIACIPIALIPGPNVLGYYFLFRAVGHLFSVRGARHGLKGVTWRGRSTPYLTRLRTVLGQPANERVMELDTIARALGVDRLPQFFNRATGYTRRS